VQLKLHCRDGSQEEISTRLIRQFSASCFGTALARFSTLLLLWCRHHSLNHLPTQRPPAGTQPLLALIFLLGVDIPLVLIRWYPLLALIFPLGVYIPSWRLYPLLALISPLVLIRWYPLLALLRPMHEGASFSRFQFQLRDTFLCSPHGIFLHSMDLVLKFTSCIYLTTLCPAS